MVILPKAEITRGKAIRLWTMEHSEYAKEQVVLSSTALVHLRLKRYGIEPIDFDYDDLFMLGIEKIVKCLYTYDINKGITFTAYILKAIDNAFIDYLYKKQKSIQCLSTDFIVYNSKEDQEYCPIEISDEFDILEYVENKCTVSDLYNSLSRRDQIIFSMYFIDNVKQSDIAKKVNLSQPQVSKIIKRIICEFERSYE